MYSPQKKSVIDSHRPLINLTICDMLTQIINARILTPQGWLKDGSVLIRDNKILEVTNCDLAIIGAKLIDAKGMYIVPGGVEIHVHGGGGRDFMEGTEEAFRTAIKAHMQHGTTSIFPTLSSSTIPMIRAAAETTEKMIRALSALFRYNLKNQDTEVCLSQELKIMEDYMYLQQMRFGDRITYRKDCSVDADKVIVPAFTFQPLVENAIIHGLSKKEEGGTVRVHIWQKDGFTLITIGDNGLGMDEAALMHLRGELEKEDGKTGIGLGNIFRRIRAMYQDGNVEIYSKKDVGTVVKIQIRHKEVGEHDVPCVGGGR